MYLNARSIASKLPELEILSIDKKPDLILITETWCNANTTNAMLNIKNYYLEPNLRCDRSDTLHGIGGGLLVYVRYGLTVLPCDNNSVFNQYCNFKLLNSKNSVDLIFTLVYRSPNSSRENSDKLCELIKNLDDNNPHVIIGDFNMPDVDWNLLNSNKHKNFLDTVIDKALFQLVTFPTHNKGNILDLILTDCPDRMVNIENIGNLSNSDHCIISLDIQCDSINNNECDMIPNFGKIDSVGFLNYFRNLEIETSMTNLDCNESWTLFKDSIIDGIDKFVPKQKRRQNSRPVWIKQNVLRLCRQKRRRFAIYCKDRSSENLRIYKDVEKKCRYAVRRAKRNFEKKIS